jgi:hypothetical protein
MVQNIRLINPNMVRSAGYFYGFDEETDVMVQKTDDGTLAFAYPLDTAVAREVTSIDFDGESYWTMENKTGTPAEGFQIKRWVIENFVMVLQQTFTFSTNATDTFESQAFAVEKYEGTLTSGAIENTKTTNVSYDATIFALLTPGTKMFLGPSTKTGFVGEFESVTVNSTGGGNSVTFTSDLTNGFNSGDPIVFSKNLWVLNQHYLKQTDAGGLYKISALDGSILGRTSGGAYKDVNAADFVEIDSFTSPLTSHNKPFLIFIRTNNLLFVDINDANLITELSSVQNNLNVAATEVYEVYDLGHEGNTLFRLQKKFNVAGQESTETTYNYQLATFRPFPTAIALTAVEAILPADSGASSSTITATVTDQYALPFGGSGSTIQFSTSGGGAGSSLSETGKISLPTTGIVSVTYTTGDTAGLVTISAEVEI